MGKGQRLAAAGGAALGAAGGAAAPMADRYEAPPTQDSAIYKDVNHYQNPAQEQKTRPDYAQKTGELGGAAQDLADIGASAKEGKDNADKNLSANNEYQNAPSQGTPPDYSPKSGSQILDDVNQGKYGEGFTASHPDYSGAKSSPQQESVPTRDAMHNQKTDNVSKTNEGQNADSSLSKDNEQDYSCGYGY